MKAILSPQVPLPLSNSTGVDDVSDAVLLSKPNLLAVINLTIHVSGYQDNQISEGLGVSDQQLNKYLKGTHNFPPNLIEPLMKFCGNKLVTRYLALRGGDELKPMLSTVEEELAATKATLADRERDLETIMRFVKEAGWRT